jgi:hypothetical protein
MKYKERNIQKLINSSFKKEYQLNEQFKEDTLELLLQKVAQRKRTPQPETKFVVAFSIIWMVLIALFIAETKIPINQMFLIKLALGLSLGFIPVSSIILIIIKKGSHEKELV